MHKKLQHDLSKRERQVMEIIYKMKSASVQDVLDEIPNPPTYSAVRSILRILVVKGLLKHTKQGKKYLYSPIISHKKATNSAIKQVLATYFDNSLEKAVTAMLEIHREDVSTEELNRLAKIIDRARREDVR